MKHTTILRNALTALLAAAALRGFLSGRERVSDKDDPRCQ